MEECNLISIVYNLVLCAIRAAMIQLYLIANFLICKDIDDNSSQDQIGQCWGILHPSHRSQDNP